MPILCTPACPMPVSYTHLDVYKRQRFAWDSYRRFVQMYGDVVLGMKPTNKEDIDPFEDVYKRQHTRFYPCNADLCQVVGIMILAEVIED